MPHQGRPLSTTARIRTRYSQNDHDSTESIKASVANLIAVFRSPLRGCCITFLVSLASLVSPFTLIPTGGEELQLPVDLVM
jgi:hypothetical protein